MSKFFKSKEERKQIKAEREQRLFEEFLEEKNLANLTEEDKEFANAIGQYLDVALKYTVRGTEGEIAQLEVLATLAEQNWMIIKLLNEINQKLDR